MSIYKSEKTQVCESCFDYIFMEMVHYFNDFENANGEKEKELKNTKLEQMGYLTGQSLAERCLNKILYFFFFKFSIH